MMDPQTADRIRLLHPKVRQEVTVACNFCNNILLGKGIRLRLTHTLRSFTEQSELYALGRTKLLDAAGKRIKIVTNAKAGQSVHN